MQMKIWLTHKRTYVILAITLIVAGIAGFLLLSPKPSLRHRFTVGERLVYRLEYLSASASDFAGLTDEADSTASAIHANVEADLHATVVETTPDGAWIVFTLRTPAVQMAANGALALAQAEETRADLQRSILAFVDAQGRIRAVHIDPNMASLPHAFARALLASTQVALPVDPANTTWETTEHDPNGVYSASYRRKPDMAVITKKRTSYRPMERSHSIRRLPVNHIIEPSGELTIRFDESAGRVESIAGREATTVRMNGKIVARGETNVKMTFLRAETLDAKAQKTLRDGCERLKAAPAIALSTAVSDTAQLAAIHRSDLGDASVDSLLAELANLEADQKSDTQLYFKLKALISLQPEVCPRLAKVLSAAAAQSRTMQILADALSSVGHAQAHAALAEAIRARGEDERALALLVPALAMVETPTPAAEDALRELADRTPHPSIRQAAELGLGTMAHQLAGSERATAIARGMAKKLQAATSDDSRRQLLLALGNAGSDETLDAIVPHLKAAAPEVRGAAAAALRWLKTPRADEQLCNILATDADATVRLEAATALGFRTMTSATFAAHRTAFANDASSNVRAAVLQNIGRSRGAFSEGRSIVTQALSDPSEVVRDEAAGILAVD